MMESKESLLGKVENFEQVLTEIRIFLSRTENNPIKEESRKQDLEIMVEFLQDENNVLKRDVDQLHVALADMKASKDYLLEKSEALEQELAESQTLSKKVIIIEKAAEQHTTSEGSLQKEIKALKCDVEIAIKDKIKAEFAKRKLKKSEETLQRENKTLKSENDQLRLSIDCMKNEMSSQVITRDVSIKKLEDQLDSQRRLHEAEVRSLKLNNAEICKKLETSKQELEEIKSKYKDIEKHFSAEKVKELIARVNAFMNICDVNSAINAFTSYILNTNLISNFNTVHVYNKIYHIKQLLKLFEAQLLNSKSFNLITSTYNQLKNITHYPNLILQVEKKLLRFYHSNKYYLTAISLCDRLVKIRKCQDAWVYLVHGELFLNKGNYRDAREAFFYSLKFSKEGDPDLENVYNQARKALEQEISVNVWTLFHTDGNTYPLTQKDLQSKYKELIRCYHPDKQHGCVKQYKDIAECMSKELTQAYRSLSKQ